MPRKKLLSDDEVLDAATHVLRRLGPHDFTLADVAAAVGLSTATLVQRFGTKRGLLVAFARRAAERATETLGVSRERARAALDGDDDGLGLAALRAHLVAEADAMGPRELAANDLAMLALDARDADLRVHARAHAGRTERAIAAHLAAARRAGHLPSRIDPAAFAAVVQAAFNGALVQWALRAADRGRAGRHVARVLDDLFASAGARAPRGRPRTGR